MNNFYLFTIFIIGFLLLAVEILIAPGFTVFGILGIITISIGIYFAFVTFPTIYAIFTLLASLVIVTVFTYWFFKHGLKGNLALKNSESISTGFKPFKIDYSKFLGKKGTTITPLRPAGKILINNSKLSAISQGEFIDINQTVKVVKVEGTKIVVTKNLT
jgi:membrane-bound serine protease (ClpP class)